MCGNLQKIDMWKEKEYLDWIIHPWGLAVLGVGAAQVCWGCGGLVGGTASAWPPPGLGCGVLAGNTGDAAYPGP